MWGYDAVHDCVISLEDEMFEASSTRSFSSGSSRREVIGASASEELSDETTNPESLELSTLRTVIPFISH